MSFSPDRSGSSSARPRRSGGTRRCATTSTRIAAWRSCSRTATRRTGMGALAQRETWQQYRYGFGPYVDGIFSQSNFGVVTKMGFWLYPQPEAYFSGTVMVPKHDDIHALVETLAQLLNSGVVQGTTSVLNTASFGPPDPELARIRVGSSTTDLERYMAQKGLGYWTVDLPFYGPAKVVAAQWEHAKEKFSTIPGAQFRDGASYRFH